MLEFEAPLVEHPLYNGGQAILLMPILYKPEPETFESLWISASRYTREKLRFMCETKTCVWKARERLVHRALKTDAEMFIFADHDHVFPVGVEGWMKQMTKRDIPVRMERVNFFTRLIGFPPEIGIVGAHYFDRITGNEGMWGGGCGESRDIRMIEDVRDGRRTGLMPVPWVAPGGMRIMRWVLEKIRDAAPTQFKEIVPKTPDGRFGFFTPNHVEIGEDVAFCARAAQIGVQSYLDCDMRIMHKGAQFF